MSYHAFFTFSTGLKTSLFVPKGTKQRYHAHVTEVEAKLRITRRRFGQNPPHWDFPKGGFLYITDEELCTIASTHNAWVIGVYEDFATWSKTPVVDGEELTPEEASVFWPGLEQSIEVPPERWTPDYYRKRMEVLYEVMRGRTTEGVSFDTKALTPKQAAQVITLFAGFLDPGDLRLDVPHGRDYLASSYDGGYEWCSNGGDAGCYRPVAPDDIAHCRRRKCPLREEEEDDDE